jgi:hypothetical protein
MYGAANIWIPQKYWVDKNMTQTKILVSDKMIVYCMFSSHNLPF